MSFIGDSFSKLNKTGIGDLLFTRPGSSERIMPRQVVLSSKCFIRFRLEGIEQYVAEFDQFNKSKRISEKKNFKPYGFTRNISLINDDGWDLSFAGKKTDDKLSALIALQEMLLSGQTPSGFGAITEANGVKLTFDIEELITYLPDDKGQPQLTELFYYRDCSLLSYSEEVSSDNQPISFAMSFFCPRRDKLIGNSKAVSPLANNTNQDVFGYNFGEQVYNMIDDILQKNKQ
jgi:hypothetical protein